MSKYGGFQNVQLMKPKRSHFDLSHTKRLTTRMGRLTPCFITECIPGDTWQGSSDILLRMAPLLAPIYDQLQMFVHFFFVPNRLLWEDWEEFITGGRLGVGIDPVDAPIPPYVEDDGFFATFASAFDKSSLGDYLGLPSTMFQTGDWTNKQVDAMPFGAYQKVYMDYYRDRNYVADDFMQFPMASGIQTIGGSDGDITNRRTRSYMHDYFTSALPFTQRGVEVLMPLAGTGSVSYLNTSRVVSTSGGVFTADRVLGTQGSGAGPHNLKVNMVVGGYDGDDGRLENIDEVNIETSDVAINDFRSAYALQVWYERNAVAGSRYVESNLAHFAVRSQDSRLQRAEYIGGGRIPVKISEVVSTAYSDDGTGTVPLANMAGHGITYGNTNQFRYYCAEHGFIIGILSIMNPPSYHQGIPRMFKRSSFLDYPWPTFAKLGEQEVSNFELYATPESITPSSDGTYPLLGYQSRYADWKYLPNTNHGDFHDSLLFWTLTREFTSAPVLGKSFVEFQDNTQDRIFAVNGEEDNFWCYIHNKVSVRRALPYFATPNTLGFV